MWNEHFSPRKFSRALIVCVCVCVCVYRNDSLFGIIPSFSTSLLNFEGQYCAVPTIEAMSHESLKLSRTENFIRSTSNPEIYMTCKFTI